MRGNQASCGLLVLALGLLFGGCTGVVDGATERSTGGPIEIPGKDGESITVVPQPRVMWRMSTAQYENSVEDIFGAAARPSAPLPAELSGEDFSTIGAALVGTSERGVELYGDAARDVAAAVWSGRAELPGLAGCAPTTADDPCIAENIRSYGRRLWRRPLTDEEVSRYLAIVSTAATHEDAAEVGVEAAIGLGVEAVFRGLLQSPNFIYISQEGEAGEAGLRYTSLDMASRIAYVVLDSTPDEELLAAGEAGELTDPTAIEAQIRRLLDTPRGQELVVRFFSENWELDELEVIQKNPDLFPDWSPAVATAAQEEFRRTLLDIDGDPSASILDVFSRRETYINADLAPIYGVDGVGQDFERVMLDDQRVGLLTSVAFLAANAKPNRTSPAQRGLFLLWRGLCESVPEAPMDVQTELPEDDPAAEGLSLRERLARHRDDPRCVGCHQAFDGLGLALEGFDAIGRFRTEDNGAPVDPRGEFRGNEFLDHRDLAAYLRQSPTAGECMTNHFYRYASGNAEPDGEIDMIAAIAADYPAEGPVFDELVIQLLTSVGFRHYIEEAAE
ncbi:MAG: DUF1592 domain-containing protein [Myxococcota bacterium]